MDIDIEKILADDLLKNLTAKQKEELRKKFELQEKEEISNIIHRIEKLENPTEIIKKADLEDLKTSFEQELAATKKEVVDSVREALQGESLESITKQLLGSAEEVALRTTRSLDQISNWSIAFSIVSISIGIIVIGGTVFDWFHHAGNKFLITSSIGAGLLIILIGTLAGLTTLVMKTMYLSRKR